MIDLKKKVSPAQRTRLEPIVSRWHSLCEWLREATVKDTEDVAAAIRMELASPRALSTSQFLVRMTQRYNALEGAANSASVMAALKKERK